VCFIDPYQGFVMAKFTRENLKFGKVAVLYDQAQAYSKGLKDDFIKSFKEMGGEIASEQAYTGGDQDFSAQLTTIKGTSPEAIFLPGYYTDVGNVALQARKLGRQRHAPRRRRVGLRQTHGDRRRGHRGCLLLEPLLPRGAAARGAGIREEVPGEVQPGARRPRRARVRLRASAGRGHGPVPLASAARTSPLRSPRPATSRA
jgi:hypothetical protein